jgi:hypothetical protein
MNGILLRFQGEILTGDKFKVIAINLDIFRILYYWKTIVTYK